MTQTPMAGSGSHEPPAAPPERKKARENHALWAWAVLLAGIAAYVYFPVVQAAQGRHDNDLKHVYLGMQALVEREEPYSPQSLLLQASRHDMGRAALNPYVYLPFTGLALAFLSPLPFQAASAVWFALNHLFVLASAWMIASALFGRWRMAAFGVLLLSLGLSHPLMRTLSAGQLNAVLLLCYTAAFALLRQGRPIGAGAVLGFAAMFKIAPALFFFYFALRRQWRALAAMAAACLVLGALSLLAVGWEIHERFLPMLAQMGYGRSTWQEHGATFWKDPWNQSPNALLTHLLVEANGVALPWANWSQRAANLATMAVSAVLLLVYAAASLADTRRRRERGERPCPEHKPSSSVCLLDNRPRALSVADQALFQATILLSLLLPSLFWDHYLVQALLPAAWLACCGLGRGSKAALALAAAAFVSTLLPWRYDAPQMRQGWGVLLMSMKLFPTVTLFALAVWASFPARNSKREL